MNETREPELIPIPSPKKTETSATPPQKGNCYEAAYETVQGLRSTQEKGGDPSLQNAQLFLVHGSVVSQAGPVAGKRIDHAWVEIAWPSTRVVFELANGKQEAKETRLWSEELQAQEEMRYLPEEARATASSFDRPHYGPWHREPLPPRDA